MGQCNRIAEKEQRRETEGTKRKGSAASKEKKASHHRHADGIAEFVGVMEDTAAAQAPDIINAPDDRDLRLELLFPYDFEIVEVDDPLVLEHGHEGLPQHE